MEAKEEIKVIYAPKARTSINHITDYIEEKGYPATAEKFVQKLYDFGNSLAVFPERYPPCKQPQLVNRNMRCALFHKSYIFVYKRIKNTLVIFNVIHSKTNPSAFFV